MPAQWQAHPSYENKCKKKFNLTKVPAIQAIKTKIGQLKKRLKHFAATVYAERSTFLLKEVWFCLKKFLLRKYGFA
jgi:hypothetical protein